MDRTFDRVARFDEQSREFPIRTLVEDKKPKTILWECNTWLDQGKEGACCGFAAAQELAAEPVAVPVSDKVARDIYFEAQKIDEFAGGAYPGAEPFMEGSSVLAAAKVLKNKGYIGSYYWAFSLADLIVGLQSGPAVLGVNWYEGMCNPANTGFIHVDGKQVGGHSIMCRGVDLERKMFVLRNTWGRLWGQGGDCYLSFYSMERLLSLRGEACFYVDRANSMMYSVSRIDKLLSWIRGIL
jgi:hypothetical protein